MALVPPLCVLLSSSGNQSCATLHFSLVSRPFETALRLSFSFIRFMRLQALAVQSAT